MPVKHTSSSMKGIEISSRQSLILMIVLCSCLENHFILWKLGVHEHVINYSAFQDFCSSLKHKSQYFKETRED